MSVENPQAGQTVWRSCKKIVPFLDGVFLALLGVYVFLGIHRVPFHGDESVLIHLSADFGSIFQNHDLHKVMFDAAAESWSPEQYERVLTGAVDPLTTGLAWSAAGMKLGDINGFWNWYPPIPGDEWLFNLRQGNMPSPRLLAIARIPSALFTAISIVVVFAIALGLSRSRPAAWIAAFLYTTTPSILVNGRRALQEGALMLFSSLAVFCALTLLRLLQKEIPSRRRIVLGYGLLGVASGLALASKHNALLIVAPAYFAVFIRLWFTGGNMAAPEKTRMHFGLLSGLLGSALLGLSVFYICMPVWWSYGFHWLILLCLSAVCLTICLSEPGWRMGLIRSICVGVILFVTLFSPQSWSGIYQPVGIMLEVRAELMAAQKNLGREMADFGSRMEELANQLLSAKTQYFETHYWDGLKEEQAQIQLYEVSRLDGRGGGGIWGIIIFTLAVGGLWAALVRRRGWDTLLLILWLTVPAIVLLIVNSLAWQRYYIILIAPWSVLAGYAAVPFTGSNFRAWVQRISGRNIPDTRQG